MSFGRRFIVPAAALLLLLCGCAPKMPETAEPLRVEDVVPSFADAGKAVYYGYEFTDEELKELTGRLDALGLDALEGMPEAKEDPPPERPGYGADWYNIRFTFVGAEHEWVVSLCGTREFRAREEVTAAYGGQNVREDRAYLFTGRLDEKLYDELTAWLDETSGADRPGTNG